MLMNWVCEGEAKSIGDDGVITGYGNTEFHMPQKSSEIHKPGAVNNEEDIDSEEEE